MTSLDDIRNTLPRHGGVSTIGDHVESVVDDAERAKDVPVIPRSGKRIERSDSKRIAYEALLKAGKTREAQDLYRKGKQAHNKGPSVADSVQALVDAGGARRTDGSRVVPGAKAPAVVEGPTHTRSGPEGANGAWLSVTGPVRVAIDPGSKNDKELNYRVGVNNSLKLLALAIRETILGGDAAAVFEAFNIQMKDLDGNTLFPIDRTKIRRRDVSPVGTTAEAPVADHEIEEIFGLPMGSDPEEVEIPRGDDEPEGFEVDIEDADSIADVFRAADPELLRRALDSLDPVTLERMGLDVAPEPGLTLVEAPEEVE